MNISDEQTMGTSEIAKMINKRHADLMRSAITISGKGLFEGALESHPYKTTDGQEFTEFRLSKRDSIILVAQNCPEFTAVLVDRWQELEAQIENPAKAIPATYAQALIEAGKLALEVEKQQLLIESQQPAVDFCNRISASSDSMKIGEFAKVISKDGDVIGQNKLFKYLRENKILMSNNMPYQTYVDRGFFEVVQGVVSGSKTGRIWTTTKITGKGQLALAKRLSSTTP